MPLGVTTAGQCWSGHGLTITITKANSLSASLELAGELIRVSAPLLRSALESQLALGRRYVRLDLSGVDFLDTGAMAIFVEMHWVFLTRRGTMILTRANSRTRKLLRVLELDRELFIGARQAAITWPGASTTSDSGGCVDDPAQTLSVDAIARSTPRAAGTGVG